MPSRKGSPNKNKHGLEARLRIQYGKDFDVVMEMAAILMERGKDGEYVQDQAKRFDMCDKIAKYVRPQLKAIELSGAEGGPLEISVIKFADT